MPVDLGQRLLDELGFEEYDADENLKAQLASSYWSDGNDLIARVNLVKRYSDAGHRSHHAKLVVDCIMASECALKSLIFSLSRHGESPEDIYRQVRRLGHRLDRLLTEVKTRAKNRLKLISVADERILQEINTLGVESRYSLEVFFTLLAEDYSSRLIGRGAISGTIDNNEWRKKVIIVSARLVKLANIGNERYMRRHTAMVGDHLAERERRYGQFAHTVGIV